MNADDRRGEMTGDKHFEIIISASKVNCSSEVKALP